MKTGGGIGKVLMELLLIEIGGALVEIASTDWDEEATSIVSATRMRGQD